MSVFNNKNYLNKKRKKHYIINIINDNKIIFYFFVKCARIFLSLFEKTTHKHTHTHTNFVFGKQQNTNKQYFSCCLSFYLHNRTFFCLEKKQQWRRQIKVFFVLFLFSAVNANALKNHCSNTSIQDKSIAYCTVFARIFHSKKKPNNKK